MPTIVTEVPYRPVPSEPRRVRWTRPDYEALQSTSVFRGRDYELVEGELIDKTGKNMPHVMSAGGLFLLLTRIFGKGRVASEASIDVSPEDNATSKPEPDLIVLNKSWRKMGNANPGPPDIILAAEISDSTLGFDLKTKAGLYARAGIAEYWVVDVARQEIIVHRDPVQGRYADIAAYTQDETVSPLAMPDAGFCVSDVFEDA